MIFLNSKSQATSSHRFHILQSPYREILRRWWHGQWTAVQAQSTIHNVQCSLVTRTYMPQLNFRTYKNVSNNRRLIVPPLLHHSLHFTHPLQISFQSQPQLLNLTDNVHPTQSFPTRHSPGACSLPFQPFTLLVSVLEIPVMPQAQIQAACSQGYPTRAFDCPHQTSYPNSPKTRACARRASFPQALPSHLEEPLICWRLLWSFFGVLPPSYSRFSR